MNCCIDCWTLLMNLKYLHSFIWLPNYKSLPTLRAHVSWYMLLNVKRTPQVCAVICFRRWSSSLSYHVWNTTQQYQSKGNGNLPGCALGNCLSKFSYIFNYSSLKCPYIILFRLYFPMYLTRFGLLYSYKHEIYY